VEKSLALKRVDLRRIATDIPHPTKKQAREQQEWWIYPKAKLSFYFA
jgi:hypothetical protein